LAKLTDLCIYFLIYPQVFEDGATYRGRLKTLGRQIVKALYSDAISPYIDYNLNSDQYAHLVGQNITELLEESTFLLAKELDMNVRHLIFEVLTH
jgi:hypothetical protein